MPPPLIGRMPNMIIVARLIIEDIAPFFYDISHYEFKTFSNHNGDPIYFTQ